ncbi:RING-type domain-containing protein [Meloidogyne graminicola]|uniref:Small nuclear ribonucleoprotein Sm D3 n=1 Tax=Meloidogyne graminicola TaxID=189291 RepID=A0A8S9ZP61_9BILA|nr:RING-type domain-containing protein [Meloidogyne graminicola]
MLWSIYGIQLRVGISTIFSGQIFKKFIPPDIFTFINKNLMGNCLQFLRRRVAGDDFTRLDNLSTNAVNGNGRRSHSSRGSSGAISSSSASSGSERSRLHRNMHASSYVNQLYMNSAFGNGADDINAAEMKALDEKRKARVRCLLEQIPIDIFVDDGKGDTECAICMGDFQSGDPIRFLPCMHSYHLQCIDSEVYRGKLVEAEDNMNCQMAEVTVTLRDGRTQTLENVFIRGSQIRFMILPDMLKNAPMFKNIGRAQRGSQGMGAGGAPRGRGSAFAGRGAGPPRGRGGRGGGSIPRGGMPPYRG